MFFYKYNKLTPEYISEKLAEQPAAITKGAYAGLVGETVAVHLDSGTELTLAFKDYVSLTLTENGEAAACSYRALNLREAVLVSFLIPDTFRGWHIILDTATRKVTAFETWFCGYADEREVQREIHYGYMDWSKGSGAVEGRHALTNRLECKGLYWKDDTGVEILNFFPSVCYSSFVEISDPRGGITICAPSDYIKINDVLYIYSRVECEYSGTFVLEVLDLFRVRNVGVRLGFDDKDAFDYRMYTADGTVTGQGATYEKMTDYGTELNMGFPGMKAQKGSRAVYRPSKMHPNLPWETVQEYARKNFRQFEGTSVMNSYNEFPLSDYMVGKTFTLRYDNGGPVWEYQIDGLKDLRWREEGETEWHTETYRAFEPAEDLIFFSHFHTGHPRYRCVTIAIDFRYGLTTCIDAWIGNERSNIEAAHKAYFGVLEMEGVTAPLVRRHGFTDELVGKSFAWVYSESMTSIHVYSSPESYSWTIFLGNGSGGLMWSSPCLYIKLRDDAYLMSWIEETCNGNQGTFVFNPQLMHDAGFFYGVEDEGVKVNAFGAYARHCGSFDIKGYFDKKVK